MKKHVYAWRETIDKKLYPAIVTIDYHDEKLSLSGVVGPRSNGDCYGSAGQIDMSFKEIDPRGHITINDVEGNKKIIARLLNVWRRFHMNDTQAACEHQRQIWKTEIHKKLRLTSYKWSDKYHAARQAAQDGTMPEYQYKEWSSIVCRVDAATIDTNSPKYPSDEIRNLIAEGWIKEDKTEEKDAHWTHFQEHPKGLLCKPCPVCGYKYGTEWKKKAVSSWAIRFLESLPDNGLASLPGSWSR